MMWDRCAEGSIQLLQNDPAMESLLGGKHIYRMRTRSSIQIPGVYYSVIGDSLDENYSPVVLQWDIWGQSAEQVARIQKRLYELLHSDLPVVLPNGLKTWCQFVNGFDFGEDDQAVYHRAVDYRYTPPRENG